MKIKGIARELEIKMRTWEGKAASYRMKLRAGRVVAKEL